MNIEIEIKGVKGYVGKIIGFSEKYKFELVFLPTTKTISRSLKRYTITEPGVYRVPSRDASVMAVWDGNALVRSSLRIDTGFLLVRADGTCEETEAPKVVTMGEGMHVA